MSEPGAATAGAAPATTAPRHAIAAPDDGAGFPWPALLLAGGLAGLCAYAVAIARRRARAALGRGGSARLERH